VSHWLGSISLLVLLLTLILQFVLPLNNHALSLPEQGIDNYINWKGQAKKAAEQKYPKASIKDFLYVGCKAESKTISIQMGVGIIRYC
jgi:hypothetical protein